MTNVYWYNPSSDNQADCNGIIVFYLLYYLFSILIARLI